MEPKFAAMLLDDARTTLSEGGTVWRTNASWGEEVRRASHVVLVREYEARIAELIRAQLAQTGVIDGKGHWRVMGYAWTQLAYIPWHNDANHPEAATVYLNASWDPDWGGLFLWRDDEGAIHAHEPQFNSAVRNSAAVQHATTPVMLDAPEPRFTLQLFRK